jgi:hypothetical protein
MWEPVALIKQLSLCSPCTSNTELHYLQRCILLSMLYLHHFWSQVLMDDLTSMAMVQRGQDRVNYAHDLSFRENLALGDFTEQVESMASLVDYVVPSVIFEHIADILQGSAVKVL